jgi:hypothetical protein
VVRDLRKRPEHLRVSLRFTRYGRDNH